MISLRICFFRLEERRARFAGGGRKGVTDRDEEDAASCGCGPGLFEGISMSRNDTSEHDESNKLLEEARADDETSVSSVDWVMSSKRGIGAHSAKSAALAMHQPVQSQPLRYELSQYAIVNGFEH